MLQLLRDRGDDVTVVAPDADDRLAQAAKAAGIPCILLNGRRRVTGADVPDGVDVVLAAHSHAFISAEARAKAKRAAIGYHPSLLPRHRGIAAVEWTIRCGDPIAAQDWCFVYPGEDAGSLWRRALAPIGLKLLAQVLEYVDIFGVAEAREQDEKAVTYAPALKTPQPQPA